MALIGTTCLLILTKNLCTYWRGNSPKVHSKKLFLQFFSNSEIMIDVQVAGVGGLIVEVVGTWDWSSLLQKSSSKCDFGVQ